MKRAGHDRFTGNGKQIGNVNKNTEYAIKTLKERLINNVLH
jgi:hypothetical protein